MNDSEQPFLVKLIIAPPASKKQRGREPNQKDKCDMKQILAMDNKPHKNNVLCGRNHSAINNEGNAYFRRLVKSFQINYECATKHQKREYSQIIYDKIRQQNPSGRFLKYEANSSRWEDIGKKKSLSKIRQALREGAPDLRHHFKKQQNTASSMILKSIQAESILNYPIARVGKKDFEAKFNVNETDSAKSSVIPQDSSTIIPRIEVMPMNVKQTAHETNASNSRLKQNYNVLNALPGPRIIPMRYF